MSDQPERDEHGKPKQGPVKNCVGFPAAAYLEEFGSQVWHAFGKPPYLVGSATHTTTWRDVDVRLILADEEWDRWGFGDPNCYDNGRRIAFDMAFSELGRRMTGLPVDFQIQQQTRANLAYGFGHRIPLGLVPLRLADPPRCT